MPKNKPHLNLIVIGHVDHGKSTTVGHTLFLAGAVSERKIAQLEKEAGEKKDKSFMFAYVFDRQTGEPVWPIIERPVPQTDVPGEWPLRCW